MTNREAHEKAAGKKLDDMWFRVNNLDPNAEHQGFRVPIECFKQYGMDLDGCSRQENQGCTGCKCLSAF